MNESADSNIFAGAKGGVSRRNLLQGIAAIAISTPALAAQDPLVEAISAYRFSMNDYNKNAPDDDAEASEYATASYKPRLRIIEDWGNPAQTREGAVAALRLARDADDRGEYGIVTPMIGAALAYFETAN